MALYRASVKGIAAAAGAPYLVVRAPTRRAQILEIAVTEPTAVAAGSEIGLIRPANSPVATTSALVQASDPADVAGTANLDTAWSTVPTIGTNVFLRRGAIGTTIGSGVIWRFLRGELVLAIGGFLVVWNPGAAAGGAPDFDILLDE